MSHLKTLYLGQSMLVIRDACEVGSGITASFWRDNWTGAGPLIELAGADAPQRVGLPYDAVVRDALRGNDWWLATSRSRNPTILLLKSLLPGAGNMIECLHDDSFLWKTEDHAPSITFSTAKTWSTLHPIVNVVPWHMTVWFKHHIPKHAFISWVVTWNRLHTCDRLHNWGLSIPSICVLSNQHDETRNHLFFECDYSSQIWRHFMAKARLNPPSPFMDCLQWLLGASREANLAMIIKLLF